MVAVATIVAFLAGFGLYGTVVFLPLFFQGVLGASPTSSGDFLTPLILGIVVGAIVSGRMLATKDGRFRRQALISTGLMALGMYLISTMDVNTSSFMAVGRALIDPAALDVLRAEFAGTQMADALLGTLHSALAEAVGDVFVIGVVVTALSVILSLFLRVLKDDSENGNTR